MPKDWERLSRRSVYRNDWIEVFDDRVTRPDGEEGVYGVVHFFTRAAAAVPYDPGRGFLLVGQERYTTGTYSWEVPQGGVPIEDDLLEGAKRELREETGLRAERWTQLFTAELSNSVTDEVGIAYLAEELTEGEAEPEGTERLTERWVTVEEALDMIDQGEIRDLPSLAALLAASRVIQAR